METASAARLLPVVVATSSPRARVCAAAALRRTRDAPGATAQPSLPPARQRVVHRCAWLAAHVHSVDRLHLSRASRPESGLSATTRRRCVTVHAAVAPASPAGRQARVGSVSNPLVAADSMPWRGPYQPVVSPALLVAAFWKFLRPHTIRGTVLGTSAVRSGGWGPCLWPPRLARVLSSPERSLIRRVRLPPRLSSARCRRTPGPSTFRWYPAPSWASWPCCAATGTSSASTRCAPGCMCPTAGGWQLSIATVAPSTDLRHQHRQDQQALPARRLRRNVAEVCLDCGALAASGCHIAWCAAADANAQPNALRSLLWQSAAAPSSRQTSAA